MKKYDEKVLREMKEKLIKMIEDRGYMVYKGYGHPIHCDIRHYKSPRVGISDCNDLNLKSVYILAHKLGHIYNPPAHMRKVEIQELIEKEDLAWEKAKEICIKNEIPLDSFEKTYRDYSEAIKNRIHIEKCLAIGVLR